MRLLTGCALLLALGLSACASAPKPLAPISDTDWPMASRDAARGGAIEAPELETPHVAWKLRVGIQGWLNSPIIIADTVYTGSAGDVWNEDDASDGVYAVDLTRGTLRWFTPLGADVNGIVATGALIVAAVESGQLVAMRRDTGALVWASDLTDAKLYSAPLVVGELVVVGAGDGTLSAIDATTGQVRWQHQLDGAVRGGASSDGALIFAGSQSGQLVALDLQGALRWSHHFKARADGALVAADDAEAVAPVSFYAAPLVSGAGVVVTFAREALYEQPPAAMLERDTGALRWRAFAPTGPIALVKRYGSARGGATLGPDSVVFGVALNSGVVSVGLSDGLVRYIARHGACMLTHWSTPARVGERYLLPRTDGALYASHDPYGVADWGIYLGEVTRMGERYPVANRTVRDECRWETSVGEGLYAPPAVAADGSVLIGTGQGYLVKLIEAPSP